MRMLFSLLVIPLIGAGTAAAGTYETVARILNVQPNHKYIYRHSGANCPYPQSLRRELCYAVPDGFNVIYRYKNINHYYHAPTAPRGRQLTIQVQIQPMRE